MDFTAITPFGLVVLLLLGLAIPLTGIREFDLLVRWVRAGRKDARLRFYSLLMGLEWGLTLGLVGWWFATGGDLAGLNLVPRVKEFQWLAVMAGLGLTYLAIWQMNTVLGNTEHLAKVAQSMGKLRPMSPTNHQEQRLFLYLSITAGICEEILYRGVLMFVLSLVMGPWPALVASSAIFGLGHSYQGWEGIAKTSAVGLLLGLLALLSGSLYVGMILHAVLDLTSGRLLQAAIQLQQWSLLDMDDDEG